MKRISLLLVSLLAFSSCLKRPDYHIDISYTGEQLRFIQCPLGGIGTGNILINGMLSAVLLTKSLLFMFS